MDTHERYEQLAVGHVLGGLDAGDAADFRAHLLGCRDCRMRVAELRDIAADLAAAEREERAQARVRTEVEQLTATETDVADEPGPGVSSRALAVVAVVAVVTFGLLAFWNLHLRTQVTTAERLDERQSAALAELAVGVPVTVEVTGSGSGLVVVDEQDVAFSFVALPELAYDERYVVWLTGGPDGDEPTLVTRTPDGRLAGTGTLAGARELVVTVETAPGRPTAPAGREVARADLAAGIATIS